MDSRARRKAREPVRLGHLLNVDEALAGLDDEMMQESQEEEEQEEEQAAEGRVAKAARRDWGRRPAAATPAPVTADTLSDLLAAAPRLVDLLLEEDQVRCITLVARDACNLTLAAGGKVDLAPVWSALATRLKNKAADEKAAAAAAAGAAAGAAAAAGEHQAAAGEQQAGDQQQQQAAQPEPEPAGRKTRRGRRPPRPPPPPTDLDVVKAAVAADPARTTEVRKTQAQWQFRLGTKDLQGAVTHRSRCIMISELDVRAAASRKYGDWSQLQAAKQHAQQVQEQRALTWEKRLEVEKAARQEELALRAAEAGLPAAFAIRPLDHGHTSQHYDAYYWLQHGSRWGGGVDLGDLLAPIITAHREKSAREERDRLLNESLRAEGLGCFRRDWRHRTFIASGLAEELPALLAAARRQAEVLRVGLERARELDERLEAAGLPLGTSSPAVKRWLDTGEGHIGAEVAALRARLDRELEMQEHLEANEILYFQNHDRCLCYIRGDSPEGTRAEDVVRALLDGLGDEYDRAEALFNRLVQERLPPNILDHWSCTLYVKKGGNLDSVVREARSTVYRRQGMAEPPVRRAPGGPDESVDAAAMEEGPAA